MNKNSQKVIDETVSSLIEEGMSSNFPERVYVVRGSSAYSRRSRSIVNELEVSTDVRRIKNRTVVATYSLTKVESMKVTRELVPVETDPGA